MKFNLQTENINGIQVRQSDLGLFIVLDEKRIEDSVSYARSNNILGIELNGALGFHMDNLDVLKRFDSIEHLRVLCNPKDLDGVNELKNLKTLILGGVEKQNLKFSVFSQLENCYFPWGKDSAKVFELPKLVNLGIDKMPDDHLSKVGDLKALRSLRLSRLKGSDLNGLSKSNSLQELQLSFCNNLTSLQGLACLSSIEQLSLVNLKNLKDSTDIGKLSMLKDLFIENCKLIHNLDCLAELVELQFLDINDGGTLESLSFLENHIGLKSLRFVGSTNIKDGNLNFIADLSLETLYFRDRRHYSHKRMDLI